MMTFIAQGKIFSHHFTAHQEKYFPFQHSDTFKEKNGKMALTFIVY